MDTIRVQSDVLPEGGQTKMKYEKVWIFKWGERRLLFLFTVGRKSNHRNVLKKSFCRQYNPTMISDFESDPDKTPERTLKRMRTKDTNDKKGARKKRDRSSVNGIPNKEARSFITRNGNWAVLIPVPEVKSTQHSYYKCKFSEENPKCSRFLYQNHGSYVSVNGIEQNEIMGHETYFLIDSKAQQIAQFNIFQLLSFFLEFFIYLS